jgi:cell wall-associated NlpC family hydrolase
MICPFVDCYAVWGSVPHIFINDALCATLEDADCLRIQMIEVDPMKGRSSAAFLYTVVSLFFLLDSAHSQNIAIFIPSSASLADEEAQQEPQSDYEDIYVVRPGDNLIRISQMFDTNPEALESANGLKSSKILIGQKLMIPIPQSAAADEGNPKIENASSLSFTPSVISNVLLHRDLDEDSKENVQPRRVRLVEAGFKLLGTRYRFGGYSEKYGFDCSGLVKNLYSKFTIDLPHSSREQFKCGEKVDRDKLAEGDLVFFSSGGKQPNHVGIYIGNDQFLHAARKADKVIISDLNKLWYSMRYLGARRITDLWWEDQKLTILHN